MIAPRASESETPHAAFYFAKNIAFAAIWPRQSSALWHCLSMLIAGVTVTLESFRAVSKCAKLEVLIWTLRGLGWPIKSHVAPSVNGVADASKLSYYISDAGKRMILEDDK
jgi:hypothetical protein